MFSIGYDIGSSSIKCSVLEIESGKLIASGFYPNEEMKISSPHFGWAEQDPQMWWEYLVALTKKIFVENKIEKQNVKCIGISYQMHGLVLVDKEQKVLRPSIIWCDSRAVEIGNSAFNNLGNDYCLSHLLNSPGNFTASKLKWVKENEPEIYKNIFKMMLPGEFIAMKMTGDICTTVSGLSEGMYWDYKNENISSSLLNHYGIDEDLLPEIKNTFSVQGVLTKQAAGELGLCEGTVVSYRAGDQPNNAFSLSVLQPGEIATTAGTSGVVYAVIDKPNYDEQSRVNTFVHVNNSSSTKRFGVLLCINGTGILNSWLKKNFSAGNITYNRMTELASEINIGSDGVTILPFGNGAERMLANKNVGCHLLGIDFNRHSNKNIYRAALEGVAFSFFYGMSIIKKMGVEITKIKCGKANMFLSDVFSQTLSNISGASIEYYTTDGSQGAARGAALGAGFYSTFEEAYKMLEKEFVVEPHPKDFEKTINAYSIWADRLEKYI